MMKLEVKLLQEDSPELKEAYELILEASAWIKDKGVQQWEEPISLDKFKHAAKIGEVFGWIFEGKVIASVTLSKHKDFYWGEVSGSSIHAHRLVVSRKFKGLGLGEELLKWSADYTKKIGYEFLRLDCRDSNPILKKYYASQGFTYKGIGHGAFPFALFEKKV